MQPIPIHKPYRALLFDLGHGWIWPAVFCPACGLAWINVQPLGVVGWDCPRCRVHTTAHIELVGGQEMPHDGIWLTGRSEVPRWPTAG